MSDIKQRIENLKRQLEMVNLCNYPAAKQQEITVSSDSSLREKCAQQLAEAQHNPDYVNFNNRADFYSLSMHGDISALPADFISFDSQSDFSQAVLPEHFDPEKFMEEGKNPGLGLRSLHQRGLNGKGIKIAIIDQPLADHQEYHGNIKHYEEIGFNQRQTGAMHGSCVTSLAVGNSCGIAPEAEVYYFAAPFYDFEKNRETKIHVAEALRRCIELNRSLPKNEKICAVSISGCFDSSMPGYEEYIKYREEASKDGLEVITCSIFKEKGLSMNGYNRDMEKKQDSSDNIIPIKGKIDARIRHDWFSPKPENTLLLPCDHRTMASHKGYNCYMHAARGGFSWLPPQAVGMYALAKQANPGCSFEHFWKTALQSGVKNKELNGIALHPQRCIEQLEQENSLRQKLALKRSSEYF